MIHNIVSNDNQVLILMQRLLIHWEYYCKMHDFQESLNFFVHYIS